MESEEAIMENENNCNLESESINKERDEEFLQDSDFNPDISISVPETPDLNCQPDSTVNTGEIGHKAEVTSTVLPDRSNALDSHTSPTVLLTKENHVRSVAGCTSERDGLLMEPDRAGSSKGAYDSLSSKMETGTSDSHPDRTYVEEDTLGDSSKTEAKVCEDGSDVYQSLSDSIGSQVKSSIENNHFEGNTNSAKSADCTQENQKDTRLEKNFPEVDETNEQTSQQAVHCNDLTENESIKPCLPTKSVTSQTNQPDPTIETPPVPMNDSLSPAVEADEGSLSSLQKSFESEDTMAIQNSPASSSNVAKLSNAQSDKGDLSKKLDDQCTSNELVGFKILNSHEENVDTNSLTIDKLQDQTNNGEKNALCAFAAEEIATVVREKRVINTVAKHHETSSEHISEHKNAEGQSIIKYVCMDQVSSCVGNEKDDMLQSKNSDTHKYLESSDKAMRSNALTTNDQVSVYLPDAIHAKREALERQELDSLSTNTLTESMETDTDSDTRNVTNAETVSEGTENKDMDEVPLERMNIDDSSADRMNVEDSAADRMNVEESVADSMNVDDSAADMINVKESAADRRIVADSAADRMNVDEVPLERMNIDDSSADRMNVDDSAANRMNVEESAADSMNVDDSAADRINVKESAADRRIVDDSAADRMNVDDSAAINGSEINKETPVVEQSDGEAKELLYVCKNEAPVKGMNLISEQDEQNEQMLEKQSSETAEAGELTILCSERDEGTEADKTNNDAEIVKATSAVTNNDGEANETPVNEKMVVERICETPYTDKLPVENTNLCSKIENAAEEMQGGADNRTPLINMAETSSADVPNSVTAEEMSQATADSVSSNEKSQASTEGSSETRNLIGTINIKQELLSDEDFSTREMTDTTVLRTIKKEVGDSAKIDDAGAEGGDVVVLDDDGESFPVKREPDMVADSNLVISSVSSQEDNSHEHVTKSEIDPNKTAVPDQKVGAATKKSKTKTQTCIVCLKTCRCKYNIVRNGDIKHLCGDDCFKRFRKTPSTFLKNKDGKTAESLKKDSSAINKPQGTQDALTKFKTCSVCNVMNVNPNQPFLNWKGLDFCGESCLGKFQANLSTTCSFCHAFIAPDMRATFCLKIGNDMRPFCRQRCIKEFNKNLRLCACCQKDLSPFPGAFSAMVGSLDKKIRQFCSQTCRQRLETQLVGVEVVSKFGQKAAPNSGTPHAAASLSPGNEVAACSVCQKIQSVKHTVRLQGKVQRLCSNLCLSAFQYTNKISMSKCDSCGTVCTVEEAQTHFVQYEGQVKRFCSDVCVNLFRQDNSKVMSCCWCGTKKVNFDMIERLDADNKFQMFCSLNCLSLYRVNLQAKSNQAVPCDQCKKVTPAQYHLTMSDASVRNFCCYTCVMTFQSQFTSKHLPPAQSMMTEPISAPQKQIETPTTKEQDQSVLKNRGRMSTRNATRQSSPSFPVISNVVSLAPSPGQLTEQAPPPSPDMSSTQITKNASTMSSGDGKHQILIQAPPVKVMKNKSLQCRPVSLTKATSCRPHCQSKEVQTDKIPDKQVIVPIPVPIYVPMPTVMYSAPTPIPVPFPIPIPVPVFIPTTRKSAAGILKTITEIVERMPADPLEAELLMMAEAVASDKKDSDSESEPETDFGANFDDELEEAIPAIQSVSEPTQTKSKENQGEEDMIQMALRMAEEMSTPIEDLESSVEPVAVNTDPPSNVATTPVPSFQADEDYVPPGSRGRGRGMKRSRNRAPSARPKRQRTEKNYAEVENIQTQVPKQPSVPQPVTEPPPDASYRLKFTYGVNAWRHWVVAKNSQIENSKTKNSNRVRTFPTDILKCTTDELNFSLIFFIKEVRKPNGEEYSPDSIYYLCLGIQQYLYENGRIDSIFTDNYFEKFADNLHGILQNLQPKVNAQGQMLCRIEEEHLWESKQLGAHSPFVLLNTLIYFHTKHFILKTAQEHMSLSFAQILKHWKKGMPLKGQSSSGKNISLRFYCLANGKKDNPAAKKNKEGVPVYEITENFENPLRCPVKLYEFFLSKCPESIKNRNDIFYPVPERSCVPDSPVWYSTQSIGLHTMDKMLTRVLLVREIQESHLHAQPIYL
ncbi:hypothetical protein EGW08_018882 [Elysia chlorotica]|uniref:TRASH domain-containing protein n=1 Tax=Elysia chlorotica TaxID=188477 RepID=A0A433SVN2_ELYCH|nr:hypothetical protein EGW08_018882 [Elysia chlorotica]